jgi:transposase
VKVLIGIDPHKGSHTAVAIDRDEVKVGELRLRSSKQQCARLLDWAEVFPERRWAIESAGGLGYLLAQQLVAAGEDVVDVPPTLSSRVRVLARARPRRTTPTTPCPRRSPRSADGACGPSSSMTMSPSSA